MADDPTHTDPDKYRVIFENEVVRVLDYLDHPGDRTTIHGHPDSVMVTLSDFRRRLSGPDGATREVELKTGTAAWLAGQDHAGHNIGDSDTHVIFVELKTAVAGARSGLGPELP